MHGSLPNRGRYKSQRCSTEIVIVHTEPKPPKITVFLFFHPRPETQHTTTFTNNHPYYSQQPTHRNSKLTTSKHQPHFLYIHIFIERHTAMSIRCSHTQKDQNMKARGCWLHKKKFVLLYKHSQKHLYTNTKPTSFPSHGIIYEPASVGSHLQIQTRTNHCSTNQSQNFVYKPPQVDTPGSYFTKFPTTNRRS